MMEVITMKRLLIVFVLSNGFFSGVTHAVTVLNGSMNVSTAVNVQTFNAIQPDDWQDLFLGSSTDIFDATTNFNQFTWLPSTDGGTFVHALGPISSIPGEGIKQDISGLTIGATYQVNFEQSISWSTNAGQGAGGHWDVVFGNETQQSAFMANPGSGIAFGWQNQGLIFTATAATQTLSFQNVPAVFGDRLSLGLDGVSISAIPIPAAVWLFGSGLIGLIGLTRHKA
jgi:hypothetical protein